MRANEGDSRLQSANVISLGRYKDMQFTLAMTLREGNRCMRSMERKGNEIFSREKIQPPKNVPLSRQAPLPSLSLAVGGALTMEGDGGAVMLSIVHLAYTIYPFLLPGNKTYFQKGGDKCSFINNTICLDCKRLAIKQHNVIFYNFFYR